jgi:hypothetical protein
MLTKKVIYRFIISTALFAAIVLIGTSCATQGQAVPPANQVTQAAPAPAQEPKDKKGVADLVKLVKAGTDEEIILTYIDASPIPYAYTAEDIVYLKEMGVTPKVIAAAINHGKAIREQAAKNAPAASADTTAEKTQTRYYYYYDPYYYGGWVMYDGYWQWRPSVIIQYDRGWWPLHHRRHRW